MNKTFSLFTILLFLSCISISQSFGQKATFTNDEFNKENTSNSESSRFLSPEPSSSVKDFEATKITEKTIELKWSLLSDATFYVVQYQQGNTAPTPVIDAPGIGFPFYNQYGLVVQTNTLKYKNLTPATTYTFIILPGNPQPFMMGTNLRQTDPAKITVTTYPVAPSIQTTNTNIVKNADNSLTITWTRGNGQAVNVYLNNKNEFSPPNNNLLEANTTWKNNGYQCVYDGQETSVTVKGIDELQNYYVRIFEYNTNVDNVVRTLDLISTGNSASKIATTAKWNGINDNNWNTAENWYAETTPISNQSIIIPNTQGIISPIISTTETIKNITIEVGGELTIANGAKLTVNGNFTIEDSTTGSGSLLMKEQGSLNVTGTSIFNKYMKPGYHCVSNPTNGTDIMQFIGFFADEWSESDSTWNALNDNSSISTMKGYSVKHKSGSPTIHFQGVFNNGNQNIPVTNSDINTDGFGWNLVGNPYPSPIDWSANNGWTRQNINSTAYVYDGNNYIGFNYISGAGTFSSIIKAGQGFFVCSEAPSASLGMNNNVRVSSTNTFRKKEKNKSPQITLKLENEYLSDETYVVFYPNATDEYDKFIDGHKLFGWKTELPQIYSTTSDNKQLSINTISSKILKKENIQHKINIGYISKIKTKLSLSISKIIDIPDSINLLLVDQYTNDTINIKNEVYSFETEIGKFSNRFLIVFKKETKDLTNLLSKKNNAKAYIYNNQIHVNVKTASNSGQITVYDILGKPIIKHSITTKTHYTFPISKNTNIFIVNVYTDKQVILSKKLIK